MPWAKKRPHPLGVLALEIVGIAAIVYWGVRVVGWAFNGQPLLPGG